MSRAPDDGSWIDDPDRFELEPKAAEVDREAWVDPETGRLRSVREMINARQGDEPRFAPETTDTGGMSPTRVLVTVLVALFAVVVAYVLISSDGRYRVTATFQNASSLVGGEQVVQNGVEVGGVKSIELTDDNRVAVEMALDDEVTPLREGTTATVRWRSLSGIANRQVELTPPAGEDAEEIPDGGAISQEDTVSQVELDELFNTLSPQTVRNLKKVIKGFADSYDGVESQANRGFRYLNPFLSTSRRVFDEINRDQPAFERLIVDADRLSGALAQRRDNVAGLIRNASDAAGALAAERSALASAVGQLPPFMQQFNTTAVNLRAALDDVDPLVDAAKPVATRLEPVLEALNDASRNLVPTVRDLNQTIYRGPNARDLVGLVGLTPDLLEIAAGPVRRNGSERRGAFPEAVDALETSLPMVEQLRPYAPELVGWFNDFGPSSGVFDANGAITRIAVTFNAFSTSLNQLPIIDQAPLTPTEFFNLSYTGLDQRCPGANERPAPDGSNPFTDGGNVTCDPSDLPGGP